MWRTTHLERIIVIDVLWEVLSKDIDHAMLEYKPMDPSNYKSKDNQG